MVDPISDFLTRIRNAQMAKQSSVSIPYSKIKEQIAEVMKKNKFVSAVSVAENEKGFKVLTVELLDKKITLKRVSRPGQRIYTNYENIRRVLNGFGISIISTSQGIITGYEARAKKVGGEVLCEIS